jgi:HK97 gp10 family phage protein
MAGDVRVVTRPVEIAAFAHADAMRKSMQSVGDGIASDAAAAAPRATGAGAASIHAVTVEDVNGWSVRVGWDPQHWYMAYHELGTEQLPARPFLRPAADRWRTV